MPWSSPTSIYLIFFYFLFWNNVVIKHIYLYAMFNRLVVSLINILNLKQLRAAFGGLGWVPTRPKNDTTWRRPPNARSITIWGALWRTRLEMLLPALWPMRTCGHGCSPLQAWSEMRGLNFILETKRGLGYSSALLDSKES
jgi:hypothetical protein